MRFIKSIPKIILAAFLLYLLLININLYHQPRYQDYDGYPLNKGVVQQLIHLKRQLHGGYPRISPWEKRLRRY